PDRHSFPTRRSSDLSASSASDRSGAGGADGGKLWTSRRPRGATKVVHNLCRACPAPDPQPYSPEKSRLINKLCELSPDFSDTSSTTVLDLSLCSKPGHASQTLRGPHALPPATRSRPETARS